MNMRKLNLGNQKKENYFCKVKSAFGPIKIGEDGTRILEIISTNYPPLTKVTTWVLTINVFKYITEIRYVLN